VQIGKSSFSPNYLVPMFAAVSLDYAIRLTGKLRPGQTG
jgi:hypothetical protein